MGHFLIGLLILLVVVVLAIGVGALVAAAKRGRADGPAPALPTAVQDHVRDLMVGRKKIEAVKYLREATRLDLAAAKDAAERIGRGERLPTPDGR